MAVRQVRGVPSWWSLAELAGILRWHIAEFGVAPDGRLFRQPNGGVVGSSTYSQVWRAARELALACIDGDDEIANQRISGALG